MSTAIILMALPYGVYFDYRIIGGRVFIFYKDALSSYTSYFNIHNYNVVPLFTALLSILVLPMLIFRAENHRKKAADTKLALIYTYTCTSLCIVSSLQIFYGAGGLPAIKLSILLLHIATPALQIDFKKLPKEAFEPT